MAYLKVKGEPNLVRDSNTNAILNIDDDALKKYYEKRDKILAEKAKQKKQEEELENLKKEISEIKDILKILVQKLGV